MAVHARAGEAGGSGRLTKRAQILLELVVDVKNNRWEDRGREEQHCFVVGACGGCEEQKVGGKREGSTAWFVVGAVWAGRHVGQLQGQERSGGACLFQSAHLPLLPCWHKRCRTREEAKRKAVVLAPAIGKWLKQCGAPDASVGGITWRKVLQPGKKVSTRFECLSFVDAAWLDWWQLVQEAVARHDGK